MPISRCNLMTAGALITALSICGPAAGGVAEPAQMGPEADQTPSLEPAELFQRLVERYRRLETYEDRVDLVHVTTRSGQPPHRVETRIACHIVGGTLRVETPGSQVRDGFGLDVPLRKSPATEALVLQYNLWLAPHLTLRFTEDPLRQFRVGVKEGFVPTKAEPVTVGDRRLVRLELKSRDPSGGESEHYTARFHLYVDLESMLIERIEGEQRLPDGADYRTVLDITPLRAPHTLGGADSSLPLTPDP